MSVTMIIIKRALTCTSSSCRHVMIIMIKSAFTCIRFFLQVLKKRAVCIKLKYNKSGMDFVLIVILSLLYIYCRYFHQVLPMNNRDHSGLGPRCGLRSEWTVYARASNRWGANLCYCSYSICWLQPRCIVLYWGWD